MIIFFFKIETKNKIIKSEIYKINIHPHSSLFVSIICNFFVEFKMTFQVLRIQDIQYSDKFQMSRQLTVKTV